jgi:hypothetical protein
MKLVIGKWLEEQTPLLAVISFAGSQLAFKGCHVTSLTEESFKLTSPHRESQLIFRFSMPGTTFAYAEMREAPELAGLSPEQSLTAGVLFGFGPTGQDRLCISEIVSRD